MVRADYNARLIEEHKIWAIVDLDQGRMSVTNDIENVVDEICTVQNIEAKDYKWIYQDSDGIWDGWNPEKETFISLGVDDEADAIQLILQHEEHLKHRI
jgi:hypothetical protein